MNDAPTHWTQFDRLYDLPDPRPYFRGVENGDYRMPGVLAEVLRRLMPVLSARPGRVAGPLRLVDFACGHGAVGLCLRYGMSMKDLFAFYRGDADPGTDADAFAARLDNGLPPHTIAGIDIAANALDYARRTGALDEAFAENVLNGGLSPALGRALGGADLIYESGAIGDHVAAAMDALLGGGGKAGRAWLLLCPRPRVDVAALEAVLRRRGYTMLTLLAGVQYRKPFSEQERTEESASGVANGLSAEECFVGDYFRTDIRIGVPEGEGADDALAAMKGFSPNPAP